MPNFGDLLGALMQSATSSTSQGRISHALEDLGQPAAGTGGGMGDLLGEILGAVQGGLSSAAQNPMQAGGLGALAGALFGGGGDSVKGALGGGALAMLAGVAAKALMNGGQGSSSGLPLGLKAPETPEEAEGAEQKASLVVRAMINAAKADGEVDSGEMQRIVGKLKEAGADAEAQSWVLNELTTPMNLDALVADIPNLEVAAEVYAASLLAIEVDTDAERTYLSRLAAGSGLNDNVVRYIHQSMGV